MNEQEINRLATSLTHFLAIDYTILAGAVIWGYDILLTLDDEVSLLWTRGGWFIKILKTENRYLPMMGISLTLDSK